jgi:hypothetical protein
MAEAAVMRFAQSTTSRQFYVWMSGICLAIAVLGFMPTYFVPVARGQFSGEPVVHIHGAILFAWVALFFTQSLLVARGKILAHRSWGMLGVSIATAMVFIIVTLVSLRIRQASAPGQPAGMAHDVRAFEWPIISELLYFVPVFVWAIVTIRRPEIHKRLLLLATISMMGAPIGRVFMTLLAPAPSAAAASVSQVPPVSVLVPPALIGDLLIVAAMIYDWRTRGRPHPVYVIGGGVALLLQLTASPVAASPSWQMVAAAIGHLAG